jgi:hypothetical protein
MSIVNVNNGPNELLRLAVEVGGGEVNANDWYRHRSRIVFDGVALCALGLIPWMIVLGFTLPGRYEVGRWGSTWLGFDGLLLIGFTVTAWAMWRHRPIAILFAVATGTLLAADAWFDMLTASGRDLIFSAGNAGLVELPLASWLFYSAYQLFKRATGSISIDDDGSANEPSFGAPGMGER